LKKWGTWQWKTDNVGLDRGEEPHMKSKRKLLMVCWLSIAGLLVTSLTAQDKPDSADSIDRFQGFMMVTDDGGRLTFNELILSGWDKAKKIGAPWTLDHYLIGTFVLPVSVDEEFRILGLKPPKGARISFHLVRGSFDTPYYVVFVTGKGEVSVQKGILREGNQNPEH
jgi:hypothetical protein